VTAIAPAAITADSAVFEIDRIPGIRGHAVITVDHGNVIIDAADVTLSAEGQELFGQAFAHACNWAAQWARVNS
jgi:hypothetical protein